MLKGGSVQSYDDHRMIMTMTVAASMAQEEVRIDSIDKVSISYPSFFADLERSP